MRYLIIMLVVVFALWSGVSAAEVISSVKAGAKTKVTDRNTETDLKPVETGDDENVDPEEGYGVDEGGVSQNERVYDENTGLPDVVPSDSFGELE